MTLSYTAAVLCVLVGGVYVYTSQAAKEHSYPTPISEDLVRPVTVPVREEVPVAAPVPAPDAVEPTFRPTAVIDVPGVGLRNTPDIAAKTRPGVIKRGEGVEIIGRSSSTGPDWVKIKTGSGKVGWVFASVVKERKRK